MQPETFKYFEIKEVGEDGSFSGIASVYGMEDLGGDVIDKGAFKKTISENPVVPILWQHNREEVIGEGTVSEWQGKILLKGTLDLEDPTAVKAYKKMKKRLIKGLSIGFNTIKQSWEEIEGRSIRHISELKLWEVSVVTFPMLPAAQVTGVKSTEDLEARLAKAEAENKRQSEEISALQARLATFEEKAGEGEQAAIEAPNEPDANHSVDAEFFQSWKAALKQ